MPYSPSSIKRELTLEQGIIVSLTLHILAIFWFSLPVSFYRNPDQPDAIEQLNVELVNFENINIEKVSSAPDPLYIQTSLSKTAPSQNYLTKNSFPLTNEVVTTLKEPVDNEVSLRKSKNIVKTLLTPINKTASHIPSVSLSGNNQHPIYEQGFAGVNASEKFGAESANYEQIIISKLEKFKHYPEKALTRGLEGDLVLHIKISGLGEVVLSEIKKSSGFSFFDEEALSMVKRASPFPKAPVQTHNQSLLAYIIPISFRLS